MAKKKKKKPGRKNAGLQALLSQLLSSSAAPGPLPQTDWSQYEALEPGNPGSLLSMLGGMGMGSSYQNEFSLMGGQGGGGGGRSPASDAIMGAARESANVLRGVAPAIGGYYNTATGREQASMAGLYNQLQNSGSSIGSNIAMQLGQAGQNVQPGIDVGNIGGQAAATASAMGSANLSALIGQGAAAQSWASTLPGVAMQQGAADAALAAMGAQEANRDRAAQMAEAQMEMEQRQREMAAELLTAGEEREFQKAIARLQFGQDLQTQTAEARESDLNRQAGLVEMLMKIQEDQRSSNLDYRRDIADREDRQAFEAAQAALDRELRRLENAGQGGKAVDLQDVFDLAERLYTSGASRKIYEDEVDRFGNKTRKYVRTEEKRLAPEKAYARITKRLRAVYPNASAKQIRKWATMALGYGGYSWRPSRASARQPSAR